MGVFGTPSNLENVVVSKGSAFYLKLIVKDNTKDLPKYGLYN